MPSIAETTLSSPLTCHLYSPFLMACLTEGAYKPIIQVRRQRKPLGTILGERFRSVAPRDTPWDDFVPHTAHLTGLLTSHVHPSLTLQQARDTLDPSCQVVSRLHESLEIGLSAQRQAEGLKALELENLDLTNLPDCVLRSFLSASYWDHIVSVTTTKCRYASWETGPGYHTSRQMTVVHVEDKRIFMSHDALLMIKDVAMSQWLLHLYFHVVPDKKELCPILTQFTSWGMKLAEILGEEAYESIKGVEGLVKLRLIQMSEKILDPDIQIVHMLRKYRKKTRKAFQSKLLARHQGIDGLWKLVSSIDDPDTLSELFSFVKLLGHPYIDPVAGCESSKALSQEHRSISPSAVKQLEWSFCHTYTRGYLSKMGKWPSITFSLPEGKESRLKDLRDNNHPSLPLGLGLYDASDWDYAVFDGHIDFDYGRDILALISDTAISYKRTEVDNSWKGRLPFTPVRPTSSTRVLEELLHRPELDMKALCQQISRRDIPFDWRIVTVCPKEREMKLEPRMFSMMVLEMRSFFVLTEQNLAHGIFKYVPEQSMTDSKTQLLQRFLKLTTTTRASRSCTLKIELDFSRWNLKFERRTMDPLGRRFDQIFGTTRLYDVVHEFYETCMVVLRHSSFTPNLTKRTGGRIADQPGIWNGHPTGMEGIFQKGWTLATICIIQAAIWPFGLKYNIVGQGDNQVLFIECLQKEEESWEEFKIRVRQLNTAVSLACSTFAASVGHELKPEECSAGTSFTSYGKELWYEGRVLETTCKSVSRMFPTTTTDTPSMFQVFSNISATGASTTDRSGYTLTLFLFTKLIENWMIRREFRRSFIHGNYLHGTLGELLYRSQNIDNWDLLLTIVPTNLGGLPVSTLAEFLYRGHQDPLASSLCSLRVFASIKEVRLYLNLLCTEKLFDPPSRIQLAGLVLDPFSVPIARQAPASASVSSRLRGILIKVTKNRDIRELLIYNDRDRDQFIKDLLTIVPLSPKVIHDIYKCSLFGTCDTFSKRFTNTSTLYKIARSAEDEDLTTLCLALDRSYILKTMDLLARVYQCRDDSNQFDRPLDMYKLAASMRKRWGVGDMEGVTNIHPLDLGVIAVLPYDLEWVLFHARHGSPMVVATALSGDSRQALKTRGKVTPYIGSTTSEKSVSKWVRPVDSSPPQRDAIKLLQIRRSLTTTGSKLYDYITKLAQSRCGYDVEQLSMFTRDTIGGTDSHRYNMTDAPMGSYVNSTTTWASHITVSSNKSGTLGSTDRPVSFQEIYLTESTLSCWYLGKVDVPAPYGCVLVVTEDTGLPVIADSILESDSLKLSSLRPSPGLFYSKSMEIKVSSRYPRTALHAQTRLFTPNAELSPVDAVTAIFLDVLTGRMKRVRTGSYVRAEVRLSRVIDMPECQRIPYKSYLSAASRAVLSYISSRYIRSLHRNVDVVYHLLSMSAEAALLLVPSVLSTLQECRDIPTEYGLPVIGGQSRELTIKWWVLQILQDVSLTVRSESWSAQGVYLQGLSSLSTTIYNVLTSWMVWSVVRVPTSSNIVSSKKLEKILGDITTGEDEYSNVERLALFVHASNLYTLFRIADTSPQRDIRKYRLEEEPPAFQYNRLPPPSLQVCFTDLVKDGHCIGTDRLAIYQSAAPDFSLTDMLYSYELRLWFSISDAHLRWGPVWHLLPRTGTVLVIGIGAGGILRVIPPSVKVTGLDLSAALESLGQSCVDYHPPVGHPRFDLHPLSWLSSGDITQNEVVSALLDECREGLYDTVLIDVEGVDTMTRLSLRQKFAQMRTRAYVRVAGTTQDISTVASSFCAFHEVGDYIWAPKIGLSREIILGGGVAPLGLYVGVCQETTHSVPEYDPPVYAIDEQEQKISEQLAFWSLSGEISSDVIAIEHWVRDYREWPEKKRAELLKIEEALEYGVESEVHLPKHLIRGFVLLWKLHHSSS